MLISYLMLVFFKDEFGEDMTYCRKFIKIKINAGSKFLEILQTIGLQNKRKNNRQFLHIELY